MLGPHCWPHEASKLVQYGGYDFFYPVACEKIMQVKKKKQFEENEFTMNIA